MLTCLDDTYQTTPAPRRGIIPAHRSFHDMHLLTYLEGSSNYAYIYRLTHPTPLLASMTLKYFEQQLPQFIRISKRHLVNPAHIHHVHVGVTKELILELTGGHRLAVARRRYYIVRRQLASLVSANGSLQNLY